MITAVLDACVLYPAALRDLFMHLTVQRVFQPKWTAAIQDEWIRNVLKDRPDLNPHLLARTRASMERWGGEWQVPEVKQDLASLDLPDPDDRHVLAAAIASGAQRIITFNLRHFPQAVLGRYGIGAEHPDAFTMELLSADPTGFTRAVAAQRDSLKRPPKSVDEYLDTLIKVGLPRVADQLVRYRNSL